MSDVLLERIATALETIAAAGALKPATPGTPGTSSKGAAGATAPPAPDAAAKAAAKAAADKKAADAKAAAEAAAKAAAAAAKPGAKGATPAAATKAPGGKYNSDQVRDMIRKVAANPNLGKQSARDILEADGGGVTTVSEVKPENFDAVYEACQVALSGEGAAQGGTADPDDPTA